jgi:hypothetical protein
MASGEVIEGHETARIGEGGGRTGAMKEREYKGRRPNSSRERKDVAKRKRGRVEERKTEAGVVF